MTMIQDPMRIFHQKFFLGLTRKGSIIVKFKNALTSSVIPKLMIKAR